MTATEPGTAPVDDYELDDDYGDEWACTHCNGEPDMQECDDPIQCCDPRCNGVLHPCVACNGTGERRHQWSF